MLPNTSRLIGGILVVAPCSCGGSGDEPAARVGSATVSWPEIEDRAALDHVAPCSALDRWVEEELLVLAVCSDRPAEAACRTRDRSAILSLAVAGAPNVPAAAEVAAVGLETPFLEQRGPVDPGLARALAQDRSARRFLSQLAARQRRKTRVVLTSRCRAGGQR